MEQEKITLYLAMYGSILSTIAIIWNIVRDIRDRPDIKVDAKLVERPGVMFDPIGYICVELSNIGKRPITIVQIQYEIGKQIHIANLRQKEDLPKELGEGQFHQVDISKEDISNIETLKFFTAKDARGILYKSKKYPLRKN